MTDHDPFDQDHPIPEESSPTTSNGVPVARPAAVAVARPRDPDRARFRLERSSPAAAWLDILLLISCLITLELTLVVATAVGTGFASVDDVAPLPREAQLETEPGGIESEFHRTMLVPLVLVRAAVACGIIWLIVTARKQGGASLGLGRRGWAIDTLIGIAALPFVYGFILLVMLLIFVLVPGLQKQMTENVTRIMNIVPKMPIVLFFLFALAIGFYEELIFRGFLLTRLRRGTNSWIAAVVLSTVAFTLPHALDQTLIALVPVGILSVSFSLLTIWRRSIVPAIVAHWLFNFSQFVLIYYVMT